MNRATGRREGGLIGFSHPQMETVARIERAMPEGDTAYMRDYLSFANRDKRLDRMVLKAIREGRALAPEEAERVTRLYANKPLKYRGDTISILETHSALARSKRDAFQMQIDDGKLRRAGRDEEMAAYSQPGATHGASGDGLSAHLSVQCAVCFA